MDDEKYVSPLIPTAFKIGQSEIWIMRVKGNKKPALCVSYPDSSVVHRVALFTNDRRAERFIRAMKGEKRWDGKPAKEATTRKKT